MPVGERLVALGGRRLFSVDGVDYAWADVLAWGERRGTLEELRDDIRRGNGAARKGVPQEDVSAAATSFRYGRGLLAAEELDEWLARWQLTLTDWGAYLERTVAREHFPAEPPAEALDGDDLYVDGICSGFFEAEAKDLAEAAALAAIPAGEADDRETLLARIEAGAAIARAGASTATGVEREIKTRGLDWTLVEVDELELGNEGAAREAAMSMRVDGRPIAEVAAACAAPLRHLRVYLADAGPTLSNVLLTAQPGDLVGPVENDDGYLLLAVTERTPPAATDPELRRRAESTLVDRAVKRALEQKVDWHEHL